MDLPLPLDQFWFNIVLWLLITTYGASWIWNFIAFVPGWNKDDFKILKYSNKSNYAFWLISSLLFFLLGISQLHYSSLVYLTMWEMYLTIFIYLFLIIKKWRYFKHNKDKQKEITRKK